uniref:Uncharacterized protein n=1 Tax=Avena sativa TaxID=4498 RepID=A0ACD5YK74_AVESA
MSSSRLALRTKSVAAKSTWDQITLNSITEEIGGDVFSLLIDEAADVSDKEQMAVVLRYLSKHGCIVERLAGVVHVKETSAVCLKAVLQKLFTGSANILSQSLEKKDQDILNAISCVKSTRNELQKLRENGWDSLLEKAYLFCEEHHIERANMQEDYVDRHAPRKKTNKTNLQHFQIECLNFVIDWQLQEFDDRFNEVNSALLGHMASFSPKDSFVDFNSESLVELAKFYPDNFNSENLDDLGHELITYIDNEDTSFP